MLTTALSRGAPGSNVAGVPDASKDLAASLSESPDSESQVLYLPARKTAALQHPLNQLKKDTPELPGRLNSCVQMDRSTFVFLSEDI